MDLFPTYIYMSGFVFFGRRYDNRNFYLPEPRRESEVKKRDSEIELSDGQFLFLSNFLGNFLCEGSNPKRCKEDRSIPS